MRQLYYGDNLEVLKDKIRSESVDLCYIDPPFNSNRNYNQIYKGEHEAKDAAQVQAFMDTWAWGSQAKSEYEEIAMDINKPRAQKRYTTETIYLIAGLYKVFGKTGLMAYLVSMATRLNEIWRTLKPTGSFYLHCDRTASHYLKLLCDSMYIPRGGDFKNEIVWKRGRHALSKKSFDAITDTLLFYTKSHVHTFHAQYQALDAQEMKRRFSHVEEGTGKRFMHCAIEGSSNAYNKAETRTIHGKTLKTSLGWKWTQETFDERLKKNPNLIYWTKGGRPRYKIYADEYPGELRPNLWDDILAIQSNSHEALGYPTQKSEALLERIIKASSKEGDVVLDAYGGCGTTIAVAERLDRRWISMDMSYQSIALVLRRLKDSLKLKDSDVYLDGIPKDMKGARALASKGDDRLRKEFEKWAVLCFTENRGRVNESKGADKGIDGRVWFGDVNEKGREVRRMAVLQVKSGAVKRSDIAVFIADMQREKAAMGYFLTLARPTKPMREEAEGAGEARIAGKMRSRVVIVPIEDLFKDPPVRIDLSYLQSVHREAAYRDKHIQADIEA